jgi:hypothetical protein
LRVDVVIATALVLPDEKRAPLTVLDHLEVVLWAGHHGDGEAVRAVTGDPGRVRVLEVDVGIRATEVLPGHVRAARPSASTTTFP